jgi:TRAP-type mannitol/chloroaromatic compound transport system permease small subunit
MAKSIPGRLDGFIGRIGQIISWFYVVLIGVIIIQVVLRYIFKSGMIILEELQWHLYGACIMIAMSYTLVHRGHIRLDLLFHQFSPRTKEFVDIFGTIFLLLPFLIAVFYHSLSFVGDSWHVSERSVAPMGLPARYIIKSFIPIGSFLLGLAAVSRLIQAWHNIAKKEQDSDGTHD